MIAWTYDPLIRRNAYFNLVKLGARPVEYLRNFYGVMDDMINGGTRPTGCSCTGTCGRSPRRTRAPGKPRLASFADERARGAVVALRDDGDGLPVPGLPLAGGTAPRTPRLLVGVPADIEAMRLSDPARAAAWRTALRDVLRRLSRAGRAVTGL